MATFGGNIIFYAVLIAPGFIAVMTAISLAAIEHDYSSFVLLVWSLVLSLIIDTGFLTVYQSLNSEITSFDQLTGLLFEPYFRVDYIGLILLFSILLGIVGAIGILVDIPGRLRRLLQALAYIKYNPRQPWANFMQDTGSVRIKTTDDQLFAGEVIEWSRAGREKEVRIADPYRYNEDIHEYEPVGREDMLFLEKDIDRLLMRTEFQRPSLRERLADWFGSNGTAEGPDEHIEPADADDRED